MNLSSSIQVLPVGKNIVYCRGLKSFWQIGNGQKHFLQTCCQADVVTLENTRANAELILL